MIDKFGQDCICNGLTSFDILFIGILFIGLALFIYYFFKDNKNKEQHKLKQDGLYLQDLEISNLRKEVDDIINNLNPEQKKRFYKYKLKEK